MRRCASSRWCASTRATSSAPGESRDSTCASESTPGQVAVGLVGTVERADGRLRRHRQRRRPTPGVGDSPGRSPSARRRRHRLSASLRARAAREAAGPRARAGGGGASPRRPAAREVEHLARFRSSGADAEVERLHDAADELAARPRPGAARSSATRVSARRGSSRSSAVLVGRRRDLARGSLPLVRRPAAAGRSRRCSAAGSASPRASRTSPSARKPGRGLATLLATVFRTRSPPGSAAPSPARSGAIARCDPQTTAGDRRQAFLAWIEALARTRPVVVAVEDLQWALPAARELARAPARRDRSRGRPARCHDAARSRLGGGPASACARLATTRIRRSSSASGRSTEDESSRSPGRSHRGLDDETVASVVARSEGNPLFLEELVRVAARGRGRCSVAARGR